GQEVDHLSRYSSRCFQPEQRLFFLTELLRQQISKSGKELPARAGRGEAAVEADVEHQSRRDGVSGAGKETRRMALKKWLREVPEFAGPCEFAGDGMSDGERLPKLGTPQRIVNLLVEDVVGIDVPFAYVCAQQENGRVPAGPEVQVWRSAVIHRPKVADGESWAALIARKQHSLCSQ